MKMIKRVIIAAAVLGCTFMASAKKWTNFVGIGAMAAVPELDLNIKESNAVADKYKIKNQFGFSEMYMGVHENGFAVRGLCDLFFGKGNVEIDDRYYFTYGIDFMAGAGYAPVRTEHFTLGIFGMGGFLGTASISEEKKMTSGLDTYTAKNEQYFGGFQAGGNLTAVFTPKKCVSLWLSCTTAYVLPGEYQWNIEVTKGSVSNTKDKFKTDGALRIIPEVGVCWKF